MRGTRGGDAATSTLHPAGMLVSLRARGQLVGVLGGLATLSLHKGGGAERR